MTNTETEGAVLVWVSDAEIPENAESESESLISTLGYEVRAFVSQRRPHPDKAYYIGSGKLEEVKSVAEATDSSIVVFENRLSGTQMNNLEKFLGLPVIDRDQLIIEIFARHAVTNEGKLQVELMRKKKLLPKVLGQGTALSRQGGGGAGGGGARRGGGEQQQELDKRTIRREIKDLEGKLEKLSRDRALRRRRRKKNDVKVISLVGYTNAGKSSLMNALTGAGVGVEDKLFHTLDPVVRKVRLGNLDALLVDTVGFISRLPHEFVDAFHSTLEETVESDALIHVVDLSSENASEEFEVVNSVLEEIGAGNIPVVTALNKCDRLFDDPVAIPARENVVRVSAKYRLGLEELKERLLSVLNVGKEDFSED